jgi:hypothetical protein
MIRLFQSKELGKERIIEFLRKAKEHYPDQVGSIDLQEWPQKLDQYAEAICYLDENGIITAAIFFYCNDLTNKTAYVTFFCSLHGTPKGTAYRLHKEYMEYSKERGMKFSRLEVLKTNTHARSFYERQGYSAIEDHGNKELLQLEF